MRLGAGRRDVLHAQRHQRVDHDEERQRVEQEAGAIACGSLKPHLREAASVAPKASGPSTRATLNWIELSATALGRSFLSTSDGISD